MPYRINPQTGKREEIDPITGQVIQDKGLSIDSPGFQPRESVVEPARGSLFENVSRGAKSLGKMFFPTAKSFVQDVSSGLTVKSGAQKSARESIETGQSDIIKLTERAKRETDPKRKKKLLRLALQQSKRFSEISKEIDPGFSPDIDKSPIERGLALGAEISPLALGVAAKGATAVARAASAAKQGAALTGARAATSLEDMTPEERLKKTLVSAGFGALIIGGIQGGGELVKGIAKATTKIGKGTSRAGAAVRQHARKIEEPAGVWGADKEAAINQTLDKVGIKGSASNQYKQLSPKYNKLTKSIDKYLDKKAVAVKGDDVALSITDDISSLPGDVTAVKQGNFEYEKIIKEIGKVKDSKDLFGVKKWLNGRLGRVYTKIEKGNPLSPAEEVILTARDTVDNLLKTFHPEIKALTTAQSHLRDAAPSLNRARKLVPTTRVAGTTLPQGVISKSQDVAGRALQGAGKVVSKTGQAESAALRFAAPATQIAGQAATRAAPIFATPLGAQGVQDTQADPQDQDPNNIRPQDAQNQPDHISSVPKFSGGQTAIGGQQQPAQEVTDTVTGFTTKQLQQALVAATLANAKTATKQLKSMLEIEETYQESIQAEDASGINVTKVSAQNYSNALSGTSSLGEAMKLMFDANGTLDRSTIIAMKSPGKPSQKSRQLKAHLYNVADSFRILLGLVATISALPEKLGYYQTVLLLYLECCLVLIVPGRSFV